LDENIIEEQRDQLLRWGISLKQIGIELGRKGMDDKEHIVPLLHSLRQPTFFTHDAGLYQRRLCHAKYCIVCVQVHDEFAAEYIRRFLRHPDFNPHAKRMGKIVRLSVAGIAYWQLNNPKEQTAIWQKTRRRPAQRRKPR
jgi:hypothetical protein